jgi:hypothetical protein
VKSDISPLKIILGSLGVVIFIAASLAVIIVGTAAEWIFARWCAKLLGWL